MSERVVVVNAGKMNYDHALISPYYRMMCRSTKIVRMLSLLNGFKVLRVVVTKELPQGRDVLSSKFLESVSYRRSRYWLY